MNTFKIPQHKLISKSIPDLWDELPWDEILMETCHGTNPDDEERFCIQVYKENVNDVFSSESYPTCITYRIMSYLLLDYDTQSEVLDYCEMDDSDREEYINLDYQDSVYKDYVPKYINQFVQFFLQDYLDDIDEIEQIMSDHWTNQGVIYNPPPIHTETTQ